MGWALFTALIHLIELMEEELGLHATNQLILAAKAHIVSTFSALFLFEYDIAPELPSIDLLPCR